MRRILVTVLIFWCQLIRHLTADVPQNALVFDRYNSSLFELPPGTSPESRCGSWATACPAQSEADDKFIEDIALTENALFVQKTCIKEKTIQEAEFKTDICKKPFQISVLYNKKKFAFEFGYEIYFGQEDKPLFDTTFKAKRYVSAEILFASIREKKIKILTKFIFKELLRLILQEQKNLWHDENKKLRFIWISLFKIEFDFIDWTPKRIVYQIRSNNKWPVAWSCEKYDLVTEAYRGVDLDHLYSPENQKKIFSNLQLPEETSEAACKDKCLGKWLLIPIDQFHFGSLKYSLCANMATVPIWISTIREAMKILEKYLYALYKVKSTALYITSGISGQLQLKKIKREKFKRSKTSSVFLDGEKQKIPVPEILYKIVKYKPDKCPKNASCWYSATIVIHNDPNFDPNKDKICEDVTEAWGWTEAITRLVPTSEGTPSKTLSRYIYVCQSDPKLLSKLMGFSARGEPSVMEELNLYEFPKYVKSNESDDAEPNLEKKSISREVNYQLAELAKREREMRRAPFAALERRISSTSSQIQPMDSITEAEENGTDGETASSAEIEELPQNDGFIERPPGDDEAGDVVAEPILAELGEELQETTTDEEDDDMRRGKAQSPSNGSEKKRLLHTTPDPEFDQQLISDEEDDEIPDSEMRENPSREEELDAEVGSEDELKSPPKKIKKASTSFDLEGRSSPRESQSFRDEKMNTEHDWKDEKSSSPRESAQSSPRESRFIRDEEMNTEHDSKLDEPSSPRESTDVVTSSHLEEQSSPGKGK